MKIIDTELVETDISSLDDVYFINEDLASLKISERSWGPTIL